MKRLLITIIGALTLGATLQVVAGPDFKAIERAREAKQVAQVARQADVYAARGPAVAGSLKCSPDPLVLPLDRAQTTPSENRLRKDRYEAQVKACKDAAK
jgi:hypothetical protein